MDTSASRLIQVIAAVVLLVAGLSQSAQADLPEFATYQVPLGKPSSTAQDALARLPDRRRNVVNWNACADELDFLGNEGARNEDNKRDSDILPTVLGKVVYLNDNPGQSCTGSRDYFDDEINSWRNWPNKPDQGGRNFEDAELRNWPDVGAFESGGQRAINDAFARRFGSACNDIVTSIVPNLRPDGRKVFTVTFTLKNECMREQVNRSLDAREKVGNSGTSKLACRIVDDTGQGDWDMAVIGFIRILHYDKLHGGKALKPEIRDKVISKLLTMSGDLEPQSYGLFQCGNTENDTGSPQDRADERAFYNDGNFFDDLGDLFGWFINFLIVALPVALALFAVFSLLGSAAALATALTAAGVLLVTLHQFRIPETENHLLMINSSKYLTNQIIIDSLPDEDDRENFRDDNDGLREWFLQRFARITREDFIEYNSKPYQRLSIAAILNIFDFAPAEDEELRRAARIVLEFASAKFAVGSNQARRIVPFRRLMETNRHEIWGPSLEGLVPRRIFDLESGSDHQTAAMLYYTGLTNQLRKVSFGSGELASSQWFASIASGNQMMWEATSNYLPHEIILDLAINKSTPYDQRIHHDGFEIYSSGAGYLITAGGIQTDYSYGALFTPVQISTDVPFDAFLKNEDRGAGVPTTLIPASSALQHRRADFLRFEGAFREWEHGDRDKTKASDAECEQKPEKAREGFCKRNLTNDDNLCVHRGFACGTNIVVPAPLATPQCLMAPAGADPAWGFINSETCDPYRGAPPFYVVVFRRPCPADEEKCTTQWGFFEAIDKPAGLTFEQFMQQTIDRNPLALFTLPASMVGTYKSWRNETITYNALGHDQDSDESGITGIDNRDQPDIDDWKLAEGDIITADGEGKMTIRSLARAANPQLSSRIEIDFTEWDEPKYEIRP